jgi:NADH-ubiquinone oxidoreductase chain 2
MCFGFILVISSFICFISSGWFGIWLGLELNIMGFLFLIGAGGYLGFWGIWRSRVMGYFFIQVVGSLLLLFFFLAGIIGGDGVSGIGMMLNVGMFLSLVLRLGLGPFYFWFPVVLNGLSWWGGVVLMTWQKLALFIICGYFSLWIPLIGVVILFSVLMGGIGGYGEVCLKKLFGYSSIAHGGWLIGLVHFESFVFYYYFVIYSFLVLLVVGLMMRYDFISLSDFFSGSMGLVGLWWGLNLLSLGGFPPFLGFYAKWLGVWYLLGWSGIGVLRMILIALFSLYYYLRVVYVLYIHSGLGGYSFVYSENWVFYGATSLSIGFCGYFTLLRFVFWDFKLIKLLTFKVKNRVSRFQWDDDFFLQIIRILGLCIYFLVLGLGL